MSNYTRRKKSFLNSRTASSPHSDYDYVARERGGETRFEKQRHHNCNNSSSYSRNSSSNGTYSNHKHQQQYVSSKRPRMAGDENEPRRRSYHPYQKQTSYSDINNNRVGSHREVFNKMVNLTSFNQTESHRCQKGSFDQDIKQDSIKSLNSTERSSVADEDLVIRNSGYNLIKLAPASFNYSFIIPIAIDWYQKHGHKESLESADPRISFYLQKADTDGRFRQFFQPNHHHHQQHRSDGHSSSSLKRRHTDLEWALLYRYKNTETSLKLEDLVLPRGAKKSKSFIR